MLKRPPQSMPSMAPTGQYQGPNGQPVSQYGGPVNQQAPVIRQAPATGRGLLAQPESGTFFQGPGARYSNEFGQAAAAGQAAKDQAAFGAMGNLGIAAQNAMGQYGMNRDAQLTNQSIAAANAYGGMANSYYNALGQSAYLGQALSAAGLNAGAQSATANMGGNFNMGFGGGFGGGGGFHVSGPEGTIAKGRMGGGGGGGFNTSGGGGFNTSIQKGSTPEERQRLIDQGYSQLGDFRKSLNDPNNQAMALAGLMGDQFNANRAAVMDPSIINSLNSQLATGYGALGGLYEMSDYGFNTGRRAPRPTYTPDAGSSSYWMEPWNNQNQAPYRPGGTMRP